MLLSPFEHSVMWHENIWSKHQCRSKIENYTLLSQNCLKMFEDLFGFFFLASFSLSTCVNHQAQSPLLYCRPFCTVLPSLFSKNQVIRCQQDVATLIFENTSLLYFYSFRSNSFFLLEMIFLLCLDTFCFRTQQSDLYVSIT